MIRINPVLLKAKEIHDEQTVRLAIRKWIVGTHMGLPVVSQSTEPEASLEDMITNAKTKADHETLASHYELQAKALTGKAEEHRRMGKAYGATPFTHKSTTTFAQHCNNIAYEYEEAAKQHKALAELHRQMAAEAAP